MSIATTLENKIRQNRLLELDVDWQDEIIFPYYKGLSLQNIPHTIAALLGTPLPDSTPLLDDVWQTETPLQQYDRVVLFLMDGMGYQHLKMLMDDDEVIRDAASDINGGRKIIPLTSVAPSTTAVALPTLWTGGTPSETAMLGTFMFLREMQTIGDMLTYRPIKGKHHPETFTDWGMPPANFVDMRGLCEHLADHDIESHLVLERQYSGTGLSKILHRGITHRKLHNSYSDMILRLEETLFETKGKRAYISAYWSAVDSLAHSYGAHNRYTQTEIRTQLSAIRDVLNKPDVQDGRTLLILLADHGHYDAPNEIDVTADPILRNAMAFGISGDARLSHMFIRSGAEEQVRQHIEQNYGDKIACVPREKLLLNGFFGEKISPKSPARIGDLVLIPRLGWTLQDPTIGRLPLISWHGGLSDWEMLIPFLWRNL